MSLTRFSKRIQRRADKVPSNANRLVRAIALQSLTTVSFATPVDTGRARSNWQVGIGKANLDTIDSFAEDTGNSDANGAIATQMAVAKGNTLIGQYKGKGDLFISNNLDYIQGLDEGKSPQAPPNFVTDSIRLAVKAVVESPAFKGIIE